MNRTIGRAHWLSCIAELTAFMLIPRALLDDGYVDLAAVATRPVCGQTQAEGRAAQKSRLRVCGILSVFARKHGAGKVDTLWFRAAIGDLQGVLWWAPGPPYVVA